jgi:hypothetical protein
VHYWDDGRWKFTGIVLGGHITYMIAGLIFFRHPRDLLSGISILDILYEDSISAQKHYRDDGSWKLTGMALGGSLPGRR